MKILVAIFFVSVLLFGCISQGEKNVSCNQIKPITCDKNGNDSTCSFEINSEFENTNVNKEIICAKIGYLDKQGELLGDVYCSNKAIGKGDTYSTNIDLEITYEQKQVNEEDFTFECEVIN